MIKNQHIRNISILESFIFIAIFVLGACTSPLPTKPVIVTIPESRETPAIIRTPTITTTFTSALQFLPSAFPTPIPKPILISDVLYTDGGDELNNCVNGSNQPVFILYADGQLVIYRGRQYWESILSQDETTSLLRKIEDTGVLKLGDSNDSGFERLIVKGKVYHFFYSNQTPKPIRETIDILNRFQPTYQKHYVPKNLLLWVYSIESVMQFEEYLPKPIPTTRNWTKDLKTLSEFNNGFQDISAEMLPNIMAQFDKFPDYQIFKSGNSLYLTAICANFP